MAGTEEHAPAPVCLPSRPCTLANNWEHADTYRQTHSQPVNQKPIPVEWGQVYTPAKVKQTDPHKQG